LAVITASRLSVAQMNHKSQYRSPSGSPFFNNMIEVRLPHLSKNEAKRLLIDTVQATREDLAFEAEDLAWAYALAGRHPFLLQIAGASLFDVIGAEASAMRSALRERATDLFQQRAAAHFDDFWRTLDEPDQRATLVLAMVEQAILVHQIPFEMEQLAVFPWFENDVRRLADLGIVERREGRQALAVGGLRTWLVENVIAGNRYAVDFSAWLQAKRSQNLLRSQEMKTMRQLADQLLAASNAMPGSLDEAKILQDQLAQSRRTYDMLTKRIDALDSDIGREMDSERKLTLMERRNALAAERDEVLAHLKQLDSPIGD
jgi:hypothetical protein